MSALVSLHALSGEEQQSKMCGNLFFWKLLSECSWTWTRGIGLQEEKKDLIEKWMKHEVPCEAGLQPAAWHLARGDRWSSWGESFNYRSYWMLFKCKYLVHIAHAGTPPFPFHVPCSIHSHSKPLGFFADFTTRAKKCCSFRSCIAGSDDTQQRWGDRKTLISCAWRCCIAG